jgi:type II restriction/modification system DNA methylase subunit YeeA
MTAAEFKKKWSRYQGKETSAYQSHFDDLCRLLGQPTPNEADPSGTDFFCFQKRVVKDAELFDAETPDATEPDERGFADVWKKGCFAWEYKGKKKNLDEAYKQLLRYRESLLNPPLLVVCDFDRYIVKTNFNGTVQEVHEFTNDDLDRPENWRILRSLFEDPEFLKPQRTTAEVTEKLAGKIAEVARLLQKRESAEIADATTRKQVNFAQRKNLRIARFLNRIVFCFFAEDSGLLPPLLFSEIAKTALDDPRQFAAALEELFRVMAKGGMYGHHKIRYFNGHLFEEATVFELNEAELKILVEAAEADWQFIQPSIMGTLFERALDESQRAQLGAHYTSEADIRTLVEPVLMSPLRREWSALKGELTPAIKKGKGSKEQREKLAAFLKKLSSVTVLDPACGSGNFLYVALQLLLDLEKEVITFATMIGFDFKPQACVQQLKAIEINPYAYELAQVSVQIGFLQWRRDNGFDNDRTPVLRVLDGFENKDALMHETFKKKAKNLKAARAEEHESQDNLFKVYVERAWPECDVIVGNPPFLGTKKLRGELGDDYVEELFKIYGNRIPNFSDLCCYWFEKARDLIEHGKCKRAGLLATQGIRGGLNREVLKRIQTTGGIFFAEADREWILAGATVHVSMIGFDDGSDKTRILDGKIVSAINANLTSNADTTKATRLAENRFIGFIADVKAGLFDLPETGALPMLSVPNPNGLPNSDVLLPWVNSLDVLRRPRDFWIVDFGSDSPLEAASRYELPFAKVKADVLPARSQVKRKTYRDYWWLHAEPCTEMRKRIWPLSRFLVTTTVSKHRVFAWLSSPTLPDHQLVAFGRSDDFFFGLLHSRYHEIWALAQGTQLREKESGFRYTPTTCFETFPFPFADDLAAPPANIEAELNAAKHYAHITLRENPAPYRTGSSGREDGLIKKPGNETSLVTSAATKEEHRAAIAAAAQELNALRERWLNPPEWTVEKILEFPGSITGPWSRYVAPQTVDAKTGIGTVRYPRLEPKDADCAAKLKKRTLTNLYNERPAWLDLAHKKLDIAVAAAYGWNDFAEIIQHSDIGQIYDFETGGWILLDAIGNQISEAHDKFEKGFAEKILERLLALNLKRAAEEAKTSTVKKSKTQRTKEADELV